MRSPRPIHCAVPRGISACRSTFWVSVISSPKSTRLFVAIPAGILSKHNSNHSAAKFVVSEAEAAAIRAVFLQHGELSAAIELRRRFPGITDNAQARECARTIAGWKPLRPVKHMPKVPRSPRVR
jgi:hypothetical protein